MIHFRCPNILAAIASLVIGASALLPQHLLAQDSSKPALPITIHRHFLEGQRLVASDPATATDEGISTEGTINSTFHLFHEGKISAYVFDVDPGRVRIDGLPYDEYVQVLEGRLILTPDDGEEVEYKKGDSLIVPEGYTGYWYMPEKYREFVIINTIPKPSK
jgi:uncharacterized cupin superfamily protein